VRAATAPPAALFPGKYAALFAAESREQLDRAGLAARVGDVDACFRAVHTVKGMAGAMGHAAAEAAAHAAEHLLEGWRAAADGGAPDDLTAALDLLESAVERAVVPEPARQAADVPAEPRTVRVDATLLDGLLDLAGDFTAVRGRLAEAAARSSDPALARAVHDAGRLTQQLQAALQEARLVPLAELFDRLPRVVREAARASGREVTFEAVGGEAAVDRGVLDALAEPLTHLLRNAVDHGIESPAERVAAGKPAGGVVRVAAERAAGGVCVSVADDGRGVDRAAVRAAAVARGVLAASAPDPLDDAALLAVLARPGFSTAAGVSRLSGRGVGVDAALARVRALGGALALTTAAGRGTRFAVTVPLTLAVTPALLVTAAGVAYAIPAAHVRGTREPTPADRAGGARPLADLLGRAAGPGPTADVVLLDRPGADPLAVAVDRVDGQRDCVVKPVPAVRAAFRTAAGATILDGGDVALVLDVPALAARIPL
jgi:two-component system chemotaxis sensor kinase CheA